MKKHALIIKNVTHEKPGIILELLEKYEIEHSIIDLTKKVEFPNIKRSNLIIILGGPDSANDESPKILKELEFVKRAFKEKIPIFGICLGLQIMVKVLGGKVHSNPVEEIGFKLNEDRWYTIQLTDEGIKDPLFEGIENEFIVFQLHNETVTLIDGIKLLGTSDFCTNQVIKIGEYNYGVQFHFELTEDLFMSLLNKAPELRQKNFKSILNDFESIKSAYLERGKKIFQNYLTLIKFI